MKHARATMAMVAVLAFGAAWSPGRASAQCCGDCDGNGKVAINELVKAVNRSLGGCQADGICDASVAACAAQLADCRAQTGCRAFPASGQTTSYGAGSDGNKKAGATLSYTDNDDGTITDNNTGLMWEKKDDSGGIHDMNNEYSWGMASPPYTMNGAMVTEFLATLNAGGGFAGHTDWRIPTVKELQSIVDYEMPYPGPTVTAAFNTGCVASCTVTTCSCTQSYAYWSSTTFQYTPSTSWYVSFGGGNVGSSSKPNLYYVRAVRGGL